MDCNCHAGGREELPPLEGPQATSDFEGHVAASSTNAAPRSNRCQKKVSIIEFICYTNFNRHPDYPSARIQVARTPLLFNTPIRFIIIAMALALPVTAAYAQPPRWDVAFGAAFHSDYNFRGITQSNHKPSVLAYFEPRLNITKDLQLYAAVAGASIDFPNRAAAQIDLYGGLRPRFGKLTLDLGFWYYWYPDGQCFNAAQGGSCLTNADPVTLGLPINGNVIKSNLSFWEVFAKATLAATELASFGAAVYYSPNVANSGANGTYVSGSLTIKTPSNVLPNGIEGYWSAEVGHWYLGTSDGFYCTGAGGPCTQPFPNGVPFKSYSTWNIGFGVTKGVFTLDLRYYDTNLGSGDCNANTSDHTARFTGDFTPINTDGFGSNWCSKAFIVSGKFDLTASDLR